MVDVKEEIVKQITLIKAELELKDFYDSDSDFNNAKGWLAALEFVLELFNNGRPGNSI